MDNCNKTIAITNELIPHFLDPVTLSFDFKPLAFGVGLKPFFANWLVTPKKVDYFESGQNRPKYNNPFSIDRQESPHIIRYNQV